MTSGQERRSDQKETPGAVTQPAVSATAERFTLESETFTVESCSEASRRPQESLRACQALPREFRAVSIVDVRIVPGGLEIVLRFEPSPAGPDSAEPSSGEVGVGDTARIPDSLLRDEGISVPFDLPRPGVATRVALRGASVRLPDPLWPEDEVS